LSLTHALLQVVIWILFQPAQATSSLTTRLIITRRRIVGSCGWLDCTRHLFDLAHETKIHCTLP
jgi:hypothetical protein